MFVSYLGGKSVFLLIIFVCFVVFYRKFLSIEVKVVNNGFMGSFIIIWSCWGDFQHRRRLQSGKSPVWKKKREDEFSYFLITLLACALFGMIYCFSKFSDSFVYCIPVFRLIIHGVYLYSTRNLTFNEKECSYSTLYILFLDEAYFNLSFLFETVFLSPSIKVTILTYTPLCIGAHTVQVLIRFQTYDMQ